MVPLLQGKITAWGAEWLRVAEKSQQCHKYFLQYSAFALAYTE